MQESGAIDELLLAALAGEITEDLLSACDVAEAAIGERAARLTAVVDLLALVPEPVTPRRALEARILERAEQTTSAAKTRIGPDEGEWLEQWPGISIKPLYAAPGGYQSCLLRMRPGSVLPAHVHQGAEEFYMLEGDGAFERYALSQGDYFRSAEGTAHGELSTREGCTILLMTHGPVEYAP